MQNITALYLRTSTGKQEKGLESQERTLLEHSKRNGFQNIHIYSDEGFSGKLKSRPKLDEMMELARSGKIKRIIVYSFSRFARSTKHLLEALEEFNELDIEFISLTENLDTSSPVGRAVFTILSAINQLEREITAERVKNGLQNARAKGKVIGRPKLRNSKLIRELKKQGYTYRRIAELANCSLATVSRELSSHVS